MCDTSRLSSCNHKKWRRSGVFDRLKIDRSFVADLEENGDDRALVASVVQLAHSLGMRVAAEGVETEQQLAFLRERGCDEFQGYIVSPWRPHKCRVGPICRIRQDDTQSEDPGIGIARGCVAFRSGSEVGMLPATVR